MVDSFIHAVARTAERWQDPSYSSREEAVEACLAGDNRFTEEGVAFAVNQAMHELSEESLEQWVAGRRAKIPLAVGVLHPGTVPLAGFRDFLAVLLAGHAYVGWGSAALLPAFAADLQTECDEFSVLFAETKADLFKRVDAVIAAEDEETAESIAQQCEGAGIPPARRLIRGEQYAVAVIDGREDDEARSGLAEDLLLYDGRGPQRVALIWAPVDQDPDPYLHTLAQFREVFPPHPMTDGTLEMPRAFLEAADQGHAYGSGFLISRGESAIKGPAHIRWAEYEGFAAINDYLQAHAKTITLVVAETRVAAYLDSLVPVVAPGEVHRRPLGWSSDQVDVVDWLVKP